MTTFWMTAAGLAALVLALMLRALWRARVADDADQDHPDLAVYRDQLREVERDAARGIIPAEEADRLRSEVARRLLEADRALKGNHAAGRPAPRAATWVAVITILAVVPLSGWLYVTLGAPGLGDQPIAARIAEGDRLRETRPNQAVAQADLEARGFYDQVAASSEVDPDYLVLVERLRTAVAARPNDLQGQRLLAQSEARVGNLRESWRAQEAVVALLGDQSTAEDWALLANLMVVAAGGYVSPEAEQVLEQTLARDRENGTALYYAGLMFSQTGRPDRAFDIWRRLLDQSAPTDPWVDPIRAQIERMAQLAGDHRYSLPPLEQMGAGRGPSAADMQAAAQMEPEARAEFIQGMVAGLSQRLAQDGGTAQDWARLITAYGVLGRTEDAAAVWSEAQAVFAGREDDIAVLAQAARGAGLDLTGVGGGPASDAPVGDTMLTLPPLATPPDAGAPEPADGASPDAPAETPAEAPAETPADDPATDAPAAPQGGLSGEPAADEPATDAPGPDAPAPETPGADDVVQ